MNDTFFAVPADRRDGLTDCSPLIPDKGRVLYDPGAQSAWARRPRLLSGGGGLISSTHDYQRFCRMLLNGGELDGVRLVGRKATELKTMNHLPGGSDPATMSRSLFSEATKSGSGSALPSTVISQQRFYQVRRANLRGGMFSTAFSSTP